MRIAVALFCAVGLLGCGCGPKAAARPVFAAAAEPSKAPTLNLQPVVFLNESGSGETVTNTIVQWEVSLTEFKVEAAEEHGLAKLFGSRGEKNEVTAEELDRSPLTQIGRAHSNVVLSLLAGTYAARCSLEESTNLLNYFQHAAGIDVLSQPRATTRGTNSAVMQVANSLTVLLGDADRADSAAILSTNISVGPTVSMRLLGRNEHKLEVEVSSRLDEFGGYETKDEKTARPDFQVTAVGTRTELGTNEVLLLGSPARMNVTRTRESIPYLSDLPAIGRLFTETNVHTNFTRIMIMVRLRVQ